MHCPLGPLEMLQASSIPTLVKKKSYLASSLSIGCSSSPIWPLQERMSFIIGKEVEGKEGV